MPTRRLPRLLLSLSILYLSACAHVLSPAALQSVTPDLTFEAIKNDPTAHLGKTLLLGGVVISLEVEQDGSTVEIFRWRLDRWGEPIAVDEKGGRFLVRTDHLLDPVLYDPGRLVTLTGSVEGQETRPLGPISYTYPVFRLGESYVWATPFRYGIHRHPNIYVPYYVGPEDRERTNPYDPGYYSYPYTPYWFRR